MYRFSYIFKYVSILFCYLDSYEPLYVNGLLYRTFGSPSKLVRFWMVTRRNWIYITYTIHTCIYCTVHTQRWFAYNSCVVPSRKCQNRSFDKWKCLYVCVGTSNAPWWVIIDHWWLIDEAYSITTMRYCIRFKTFAESLKYTIRDETLKKPTIFNRELHLDILYRRVSVPFDVWLLFNHVGGLSLGKLQRALGACHALATTVCRLLTPIIHW